MGDLQQLSIEFGACALIEQSFCHILTCSHISNCSSSQTLDSQGTAMLILDRIIQ